MTALFSIFKLLLKVAAVPVVAILALLVWFCTWLVYVSGAVLGLVSLLLCVCSVLLFLSSSVTGGIIYLILAFWQVLLGCLPPRYGCWTGFKDFGIGFRKAFMNKTRRPASEPLQ